MPPQSDLTEQRAKLSAVKQALLEKRLRGETVADRIPRRSHHSPVSPSFSQRRLWFMNHLEPGNPAYNISAAFHLTGLLDPAGALVEDHAGLSRSSAFSAVAGQQEQDRRGNGGPGNARGKKGSVRALPVQGPLDVSRQMGGVADPSNGLLVQ